MLIICFCLSAIYSCNREDCKTPQHVERAKLMTEYFGNYKPGAYWIYLNRDSTKRDSIWISDIETYQVKNQYDCEEAEALSFIFHNQYLFLSKESKVTLGFNGNDIRTNVFYHTDSNGKTYRGFSSKDGVNNFYGGNTIFPIVDSYEVWENNQNSSFNKVTLIGKLIIASEIGIIQYVSFTSNDTFSIIKYEIP